MTRDVETYLTNGCGRCILGGISDCKVHKWEKELLELRRIAQKTGLEETAKWGVPCYMLGGKNIFLISAFKNHVSISFFKGILLNDDKGLLEKPGQHSHEDRILKFTNRKSILQLEDIIFALMSEAITVEESKIPIPKRKREKSSVPEELQQVFEQDPTYKSAFEALTPGRQRSYLIHFTSANQTKTKIDRIERCKEKVFLGKGFNEY